MGGEAKPGGAGPAEPAGRRSGDQRLLGKRALVSQVTISRGPACPLSDHPEEPSPLASRHAWSTGGRSAGERPPPRSRDWSLGAVGSRLPAPGG